MKKKGAKKAFRDSPTDALLGKKKKGEED